jgi:hypothetical protein
MDDLQVGPCRPVCQLVGQMGSPPPPSANSAATPSHPLTRFGATNLVAYPPLSSSPEGPASHPLLVAPSSSPESGPPA